MSVAAKISFKIDRTRHRGSSEEITTSIINGLTIKLNALSIETLNVYKPSYSSIKVLFLNENQVNKALDKYNDLKNAGYEPRMPIPLKAARTVYCYAFDPALLVTYSTPDAIKSLLTTGGWKAREIIIMNSRKSFKIVMETTGEAKKFIASNSTSIGGIQIKKESKEIEINPIVEQCWTCGILNPNHNSSSCPNTKKCLKCNNRDHLFFNCALPKKASDMTQEQRNARFCIPCGSLGNHTSLDHRYCPQKRSIVQARIKAARNERTQYEAATERDTTLIKKTLELSNTDAWPALRVNQEQAQKTSTIVLLTLLDEKKHPGIFQHKFSQALQNNGLPDVKYTPEPGTAEMLMNTLCAMNMNIRPQPFNLHPSPGTSGAQGTSVTPKAVKQTDPSQSKRPLMNLNDLNNSIIVSETKKSKTAVPSARDLPTPDSMQSATRLREVLKEGPIELNMSMKHILTPGVSKAPFKHSIEEISDMVKNKGFIMTSERMGRVVRELEILDEEPIIKRFECSGEFVFSSRRFF